MVDIARDKIRGGEVECAPHRRQTSIDIEEHEQSKNDTSMTEVLDLRNFGTKYYFDDSAWNALAIREPEPVRALVTEAIRANNGIVLISEINSVEMLRTPTFEERSKLCETALALLQALLPEPISLTSEMAAARLAGREYSFDETADPRNGAFSRSP